MAASHLLLPFIGQYIYLDELYCLLLLLLLLSGGSCSTVEFYFPKSWKKFNPFRVPLSHPLSLRFLEIAQNKTGQLKAPSGNKAEGESSPLLLQLLCDGGDLLHAVLVRCQVALEGLVFLQQSLDLGQRGRLVVGHLQHLSLTCRGR